MPTAEEIYRVNPTDEEIADVLDQRLNAAVATFNPDGTIHQAYVLYFFEHGKLHWETSSSTRKAKNLARNNATSFLIDGAADRR